MSADGSDIDETEESPPPPTYETRFSTTRTSSTTPVTGQRNDVTTFSDPIVVPNFGFVKDFLPCLGGPPNLSFTGSMNVVPSSPYCFRDPNPYHAERSYQRRVGGLDPKYNPSSNDYRLVELADLAFNHCIMHGLDTPFYMQDPADSTRMLDLFTYHGKFTYDEVKNHLESKIKAKVFDQYMITVLNDSAAFLLNTLDRTFQRIIRTSLASGESRFGPLVWMKITEEVLPNTLRRMDDLETLFRGRSVKSTPGENVNTWANEQLETLLEMDANDQLPRDHLLILLKQLCSCSVEAFRMHWHAQRRTISNFVRMSGGKSKGVASRLDGYVTYRDLLQDAKDEYGNLKEEWGPSKGTTTTTDANTASIKGLKAEIKTLKSKFGSSSDKDKTSQPKEKKSGGSAPGKAKGDGKKGGDDSAEKRWNRIAPKDGDPKTITKHDKKFHWCEKCGRWTQTHGTEQHKRKEDEKPDSNKGNPPAGNAANLASASRPLTTGWESDDDSE